ncbi:hypothetical protein IHE73_08310 [Streptococcus agalactiae]|nr:hypothetical protein [Streptococcus agalactiae]
MNILKNNIVYPKGKPNITFDDFIIGAMDTKELKELKKIKSKKLFIKTSGN